MNNDLPAGLEQLAHAKVQSNRFKFSDEAITAAARLLREHEVAEKAPPPRGKPRSLSGGDAHWHLRIPQPAHIGSPIWAQNLIT